VEDTAPFYQAASAFVLSSVERTEAFGIVQLEAMASGLPVVNTDLPSGVPFVSLHNITGLTVIPRDSRGLTSALNTLLQDAASAKAFGDAGRKRVKTEFSVEGMICRTLSVYNDALGSPFAERLSSVQTNSI
jgi:rhamnosyl/mannosyltransferase